MFQPVGYLSAVFNWAINREILENNPIEKLEALSEQDSQKKYAFLRMKNANVLLRRWTRVSIGFAKNVINIIYGWTNENYRVCRI